MDLHGKNTSPTRGFSRRNDAAEPHRFHKVVGARSTMDQHGT